MTNLTKEDFGIAPVAVNNMGSNAVEKIDPILGKRKKKLKDILKKNKSRNSK